VPQKPRDLFDPIVAVNKLHPLFRQAALKPRHEAARALINEIFASFRDVDHNFRREFQTAGFSAWVFELAGVVLGTPHPTPATPAKRVRIESRCRRPKSVAVGRPGCGSGGR
jgi:hypothetical protein